MVDSRAKGARGEREARDIIRCHWNAPRCERTGQTNGKTCADLTRALPRSCPEVKLFKKMSIFRIWKKLIEDTEDGDLPFLMLRETQSRSAPWLVAFEAAKADNFTARYLEQMALTHGPDYARKFLEEAIQDC